MIFTIGVFLVVMGVLNAIYLGIKIEQGNNDPPYLIGGLIVIASVVFSGIYLILHG